MAAEVSGAAKRGSRVDIGQNSQGRTRCAGNGPRERFQNVKARREAVDRALKRPVESEKSPKDAANVAIDRLRPDR